MVHFPNVVTFMQEGRLEITFQSIIVMLKHVHGKNIQCIVLTSVYKCLISVFTGT